MLKTAIDRGAEILENPPSRNEESVVEYIRNLRTARRELIGERNDPRNVMGGGSLQTQTKISSMLGHIDENLYSAERVLEAIRNEIPQEEVVETDNIGEINVQASVEKLAVASAVSTMGLNRFERLSKGLQAFTQEIEPVLDPMYRDFPRQQYTARLEELIAMDQSKLAKIAAEEFPTKEWIGPEPEPVGGEGDLGYIPSHFEKDETTQPEKKDVDGEFENAIDKERKFRGIKEVSDTTEISKSSKVADATNATPGSHEPASSSDGGAQMQAKPPEPEDALETKIEEDAGASTPAPRGPNRRIQKDVPAYSTPKEKLTAALKLTEMFENMDAATALQIVSTVTADSDSEEVSEDKAEENATGSGEESTENDQVNNTENDLDGLFDD